MLTAASKFMTSLQGLLTKQPVETSRAAFRIEDIRQAMLDSMGDGASVKFAMVVRRVELAPSLEALWFLRPELLMVISSMDGELAAQGQVERISAMFEGLLPKGMSSRPNRIAK